MAEAGPVAGDEAREVALFDALLGPEGAALLDEVRDVPQERALAVATRLRRHHPPELVATALTQARLRQRAAAKFGADAGRMYFTAGGVEQATRAPVAAHRAARFWRHGVRGVADLCCGVGGDAIAFARAGISVLAVDRSPLTCAVARANMAALGLGGLVEVRCADVEEVPLGAYDAVFADPARRGGRGRVFSPEAYSPPLSWAVGAAAAAPFAALKIAPGIAHEVIPEGAEAEWVSYGGDVKEAVLWFGAAVGTGADTARAAGSGPRRATLIPAAARTPGGSEPSGAPGSSVVSLLGAALPAPAVRPAGRYLYEPDGAVIRAHLVADVARQVGGGLLDATIAYVTADELRPTPYATAYEITDVLPFHLKRLKALLRERGVGTLTVKKRGSAVEPEELRRRMRLQGTRSATVFLTRAAGAPVMLLGHPATPDAP
ncbi:methyltransferase domain-containing protein [Streptomyces sp. NPDC050560]|uniref:class I SAM-dependent methyltransferase n=1 Tax=Streptomyces sp. NPDC050560 TaxID=3365630 RepID=UPI0037AFEE9E